MIEPLWKLNVVLNIRAFVLSSQDNAIYGTGAVLEIKRKWFNPLRWLLGEDKVKRIHPKKIYKVIR